MFKLFTYQNRVKKKKHASRKEQTYKQVYKHTSNHNTHTSERERDQARIKECHSAHTTYININRVPATAAAASVPLHKIREQCPWTDLACVWMTNDTQSEREKKRKKKET